MDRIVINHKNFLFNRMVEKNEYVINKIDKLKDKYNELIEFYCIKDSPESMESIELWEKRVGKLKEKYPLETFLTFSNSLFFIIGNVVEIALSITSCFNHVKAYKPHRSFISSFHSIALIC